MYSTSSGKKLYLHMGKHMALHRPPHKSSTDAERLSSPPLWSPLPLAYYSSLHTTCHPHSATTCLGGKHHTQRCQRHAAWSCWSLSSDWCPDCIVGDGTPISKAGRETRGHNWIQIDPMSSLRDNASVIRSPTGKHLYLSHTNTSERKVRYWSS